MKSELHLVLLWSSSRYKQEEIIEDLKSKFRIKDLLEIQWSAEHFVSNLNRFYGFKLDTAKGKAKKTGLGSMLLCIIEDENPIHEWVATSRGSELVNKNLFDIKLLYRAWTNQGNRIHATNSYQETVHDLTLLIGKTPEDYLKEKKGQDWDGKIKSLKQDLVGTHGWSSLEECFYVLNATSNYLVLRNFEILPNAFTSKEHGDIDMLVENFIDTKFILNAVTTSSKSYSVNCYTFIKGEKVFFDLRFLGDDYYDINFEDRLLKNKVMERGFFRPSQQDYFYSLIYHTLVHKTKIAQDYFVKIKALYEELFDAHDLDGLTDHQCFDIYYHCLLEFMNAHHLSFVKAQDRRVGFDARVGFAGETERQFERRFQLSDIKPFQVARKDATGFAYYTACKASLLLKVGGWADSAEREFHALSLLHGKYPQYFLKPAYFWCDRGEQLLVTNFTDDVSLAQLLQQKENQQPDFEKIATQLKELCLILLKEKIVHRDINAENILVNKNSELTLINLQFAISTSVDALKQSKSSRTLLKDKKNKQIWDDAQSFTQILHQVNQLAQSTTIQKIEDEVKSKIGCLYFKKPNLPCLYLSKVLLIFTCLIPMRKQRIKLRNIIKSKLLHVKV